MKRMILWIRKALRYPLRVIYLLSRMCVHFYNISLILLLIIIFYYFFYIVGRLSSWYTDFNSFFIDVRISVLSIVITVFFIDFIRIERDRHRKLLNQYRMSSSIDSKTQVVFFLFTDVFFENELSSFQFDEQSSRILDANSFPYLMEKIDQFVKAPGFWMQNIDVSHHGLNNVIMQKNRQEVLNYVIRNYLKEIKDLCLFYKGMIDDKLAQRIYDSLFNMENDYYTNGNYGWEECTITGFVIVSLLLDIRRIEFLVDKPWL
jgi:hypothetical protein